MREAILSMLRTNFYGKREIHVQYKCIVELYFGEGGGIIHDLYTQHICRAGPLAMCNYKIG